MVAVVVAGALILSPAPPAQAQNGDIGAALFMGILGAAIQQGQRQQAQTEQQRAEQQRAAGERAERTQRVRRAQAALAQMGFYTLAVDGAAGPGTNAAVERYTRAFRLSGFDFSEIQVAMLEQHAASGFADIDSLQRARTGGFSDAATYARAVRGGFSRASDYGEAQRLGLFNQAELDAFRASGAASAAEFRDLRRRGFASRAEAEAARAAGFADAAEFRDYRASGAASRVEFDEIRTARAQAQQARAACLVPLPALAIDTVLLACINTLAIDNRDAEAASRLARLAPAIEQRTDARGLALVAAIGCVDPASTQPAAVRRDLCTQAANRLAAAVDLAPAIASLQRLIESDTVRADAERLRLAAENARSAGRQALSDIAEFLASGGRFDAALDVARATAALQGSLANRDDRALVRDYELITVMIEREARFTDFLAARVAADEQARARALLIARQDLERTAAFLEDFLAANMLDRVAPDLLAMADRIRDALAGGNAEQIVALRIAVVADLRRMNLLSAAESFRPVAQAAGALVEQQQQQADAAATDAAARTAREAGQRLLTDIADFLGRGERFGAALDVARATSALREALAGSDGGALVRAQGALTALVEAEPGFTAFRQARLQAEEAARASAVAQARADLERDLAFAESFVAGSMLDARASELLALADAARAMLSGAGGEQILAGRDDTARRLAAVGLADQARAYRLPNPQDEARARDLLAEQAQAARIAASQAEAVKQWLDDIEAYLALGRRLEQWVPAAALASRLRAGLDAGSDLSALVAAADALVAAEPGLTEFRAERDRQRQAARDAAQRDAATQAGQTVGFVLDLVSRDPLRADAATLLEVANALRGALDLGDARGIVAADAAARDRLDALGLTQALAAHLARRATDAAAADVARQRGADELAQVAGRQDRQRADDLLADIDGYVAAGGKFADTLGFARALNPLRRALADGSALEAPLATLEQVLAGTPAFGVFAAERGAARGARVATTRAEATATAQRIEDFVADRIEVDPLRADLDALLGIAEGLVTVRTSGDGIAIAAAVADATTRLAGLGLGDALAAFVAGARDRAAASSVHVADNGLAVTALNAALLQGAAGDLLVLANRDDAPHLYRDLTGADAFEGGRVAICWAHDPQDWTPAFGRVLNAVAATGAAPLGPPARCTSAPADLVVVARAAFLALPADIAAPLVRRFEEGQLDLWLQFTAADQAADATADAEAAARIRSQVTGGARSGWGLVVFDAQGATLCQAPAAAIDPRAPALFLDIERPALSLQLPMLGANRREDTLERLLVRARRGECAGLWADAADLARILPALERDRIAHRVTSLWADAQVLRDLERQIAEADAAESRSLAILRQELTQERNVAAEMERQRRMEQNAATLELRARYAQEARAVQDRLTRLLSGRLERGLVSGAVPQQGGTRPRDFAVRDGQMSAAAVFSALYPAFDRWLTDQGRQQWAVDASAVAVVDYGSAAWNGRRLETALVEVTLDMSNAPRGERTRQCALLGLMFDDEFAMLRDPFEADCTALADGRGWLQSVDFESRWSAR